MAYENILVETSGHVGRITLNRPKALNALSPALLAELQTALEAFEADEEIGAIVLTGNEKAFAAGADIKEMVELGYIDMFNNDAFFENFNAVSRCRKPVIAAVAGYAFGGGCEIAMQADFIIAGDNAKFGQPEINLGVIPGAGGTQRLVRAVGKAKAMEMVLTGRNMDAEEAERAGLVSRVVPVDKLVDEAMAAAEKVAGLSQPAVVIAKECVNTAFEGSLSEGTKFEARMFQACFALEDRREGMEAFAEKRQPTFKNR